MKKIRVGKARPAIYHQFNVKIEMSDGSVVLRRSQFPKDEIRLIQDQRNNPLWNPSRTDLVVLDANAGSSLDKFKQRYSSIFTLEDDSKQQEVPSPSKKEPISTKTTEEDAKIEPESELSDQDVFAADDYLSILDDSSQQIKTGKLAMKKKPKKK